MNKLATPLTEPIFSTTYRVIYGDTDAAGVMYNANYLRLFEIARTEMMRAWAMPYKAMEDMGFVLPVTESYLRFKAPARYDDILSLSVCLADFTRLTCRFHYQISRREENGATTLLTKGFTVHACVGRDGALTTFPQEIQATLKAILARGASAPDISGNSS